MGEDMMEIIKTLISESNLKLEIGAEIVDDQKKVQGAIELDIENQSRFMDIMDTIFNSKKLNIIVNMENISYIDSSGLWALFEAHKKATQQDIKLILLNPTKDVKRVLDITKISSKIEIFDSEEK